MVAYEEISILNRKGVWIYKPSSSYGGEGIKLVYDIKEAMNDIVQLKKTHVQKKNDDNFSLIQKYIEDPYLLDGKKFDFRVFPMVVSTNPLLVIYLNGYIRSTLFDYELMNPDVSIHLTNLHA